MSLGLKQIVFYADGINLKYPGYIKILDSLICRMDAKVVSSRAEANDYFRRGYVIIPFGALTTYECRNDGYRIAYLVDSPTLCFKSIVNFHFKRGNYTSSQIWLNILRYFKYSIYESAVVASYERVILAAKQDAAHINNKYGVDSAIEIENGIDLPAISNSRRNVDENSHLRLGYLNFWGPWRQHDFEWFVNEIWPQYRLINPHAELIIAGRGATPELEKYFHDQDFTFMGAVDTLGEFFSEIDVFVTSIRKECGILNKMLDAFAYQVPVLAFVNNVHPFVTDAPFFYQYQNSEDFKSALEHIRKNPGEVEEYVRRAYAYLKEHHDWDKQATAFLRLVNEVYGESGQ